MTSRLIKQIIYGAGYLILFFGIAYGIYFISFRSSATCFDNKQNGRETGVDCGGQCASCEIKKLSLIEIDWIKYFSTSNQAIITAEFKNPNDKYGAAEFTYTIDILGNDGGMLKTFSKKSFIYASEIKYIFETIEANPTNIKNIKISFSDIQWKSISDFQKPKIQTREILTKDNNGAIEASGVFLNDNAYSLSKVRIVAFLSNSNGIKIAASKTEFENINSYKENYFKIIFPQGVLLAKDISDVYKFNNDMSVGFRGDDAKKLAEFLKRQEFYSGAVTTYFSQSLKTALINYQKKAKISPATGYFGKKTRDYINNALVLENTTNLQANLSKADPSKTEIYVEAIQ